MTGRYSEYCMYLWICFFQFFEYFEYLVVFENIWIYWCIRVLIDIHVTVTVVSDIDAVFQSTVIYIIVSHTFKFKKSKCFHTKQVHNTFRRGKIQEVLPQAFFFFKNYRNLVSDFELNFFMTDRVLMSFLSQNTTHLSHQKWFLMSRF